jgi:hypothetical protein
MRLELGSQALVWLLGFKSRMPLHAPKTFPTPAHAKQDNNQEKSSPQSKHGWDRRMALL